jgi:hypothetical protein
MSEPTGLDPNSQTNRHRAAWRVTRETPMNRCIFLTAVALMLLLMLGCSNSGGNPIGSAGLDNPTTGNSTGSNGVQTHLWGYYDIYIDIPTQTATVVLNRGAEFAANVVSFLNKSASYMGLKINGTPVASD